MTEFGRDRFPWLTLTFILASLLAGSMGPVGARAAISTTGDVMPLPIMPNTTILVASQGVGSLVIEAGSSLTSNFLQVAQGPNGVGTAIVRDPGSLWRFTGGEIGNNGIGRLEVRNGATIEVPSPANLLRLGNNSTSNATALVDGEGSVLQVIAPFTVGGQGTALLRASNGAIVNVPEDATTIGVNGRIELDGALLRTNQLQISGTITGSGELAVLSSGTISNNGRIEVGLGDRLLVSGGIGTTGGLWMNIGSIAVDGGELEIRRIVNNLALAPNIGRITLQDAIIRFPLPTSTQPGLQNSHLVAALGGENHIHGRVLNNNTGDIVATNNSTVFFHHDVTSQGTITVAAGSTAIFLEDLLMNGGTLLADLGGAEGYGHAEVYGQAQLAGAALQVGLSSGFVPAVGDTFRLVSAAGGITGIPSLSGTPNPSNLLEWDLDVDANQVILSAVPALDGDYNADGKVDAADFIVWRKQSDGTGPGLAADGDDNNVVNVADYDFWRMNFGRTIASPAAGAAAGASPSLAAVPEPAGAVMGFTALLAGVFRRRPSLWLSDSATHQ
jgi:T5SS/PEP-CTERM-associated repeat protein